MRFRMMGVANPDRECFGFIASVLSTALAVLPGGAKFSYPGIWLRACVLVFSFHFSADLMLSSGNSMITPAEAGHDCQN